MYFVYVLRSRKTGRLYKGLTEDVDRRLNEHNQGISRSTQGQRPWELLRVEEYKTLPEAVRRERYLKTGRGREELQRLLASQKAQV